MVFYRDFVDPTVNAQLYVPTWLFPALSALGGLLGGLVGGYFSKRGEIRAIHRELDKVVEQNKEITKATEQIKADIENEVWAKHRSWELKKEAAFRMMECVGALEGSVNRMIGTHAEAPIGQVPTQESEVMRKDARSDLLAAIKEFNRVVGLVQVTCGLAVNDRLGFARQYLLHLAIRVEGGEDLMKSNSDEGTKKARREVEELVSAIRRELGVDK